MAIPFGDRTGQNKNQWLHYLLFVGTVGAVADIQTAALHVGCGQYRGRFLNKYLYGLKVILSVILKLKYFSKVDLITEIVDTNY